MVLRQWQCWLFCLLPNVVTRVGLPIIHSNIPSEPLAFLLLVLVMTLPKVTVGYVPDNTSY
jgi:hypothetical protein